MTFLATIQHIHSEDPLIVKIILVPTFILIICLGFLPLAILSFTFRFTIKSTSIIWLPLLWVLYQSRPGANVSDRIDLMVRQAWYKVILAYSILVLLVLAFKAALLFGAWQFFDLHTLGPLGSMITRMIAPLKVPLWQVASGANAVLALAFFFRADRHLLARNTSQALPTAWIELEYVCFQVTRTTLSMYAIVCVLYIATSTAWEAVWPPVELILFPWTGST